MTDKRNSTINNPNKNLAMPAALEAIPPKPKTAAIMATIKKVTDQRNIIIWFKGRKMMLYIPNTKKIIPVITTTV